MEGAKIMAEIYVSTEEMEAAAVTAMQLSEESADLGRRSKIFNDRLQCSMRGQTANAFNDFCNTRLIPALEECSEMYSQTSQAITHTCNQFTEADGTLSTTFTT